LDLVTVIVNVKANDSQTFCQENCSGVLLLQALDMQLRGNDTNQSDPSQKHKLG